MSKKVWVVDDTPSTRFPIYTRGNVGEVFPDVVSPLSWSAYGREAELGWREAWRDYGVLLDRDVEGEDKMIVGCFGGYCYLNASYIRVFAVRTPGINVADMDGLFFGESEAPPYRPHPGDKSAVASLRIIRTILRTLNAKAIPELDEDKARVRSWLSTIPDLTSSSDRALLDVVDSFRPLRRLPPGVRRLPRRVRVAGTQGVGGLVADVGYSAEAGAGRYRPHALGRRFPRSRGSVPTAEDGPGDGDGCRPRAAFGPDPASVR